MLTQEQRAQYEQDGFIVLPGFKPAHEIAQLRQRAAEIVEAFDPDESRSVFTTREQRADDWFLGSDNTVRCFFEEEAFDAEGQLRQAKALSINKIGHAMHDLDPVFERFTRDPKLAAVARDLGLAQAQVWQSMYIFKQPGIGGEVRWHQDATFFETTPISVTTFWFALEDATIDNGCWCASTACCPTTAPRTGHRCHVMHSPCMRPMRGASTRRATGSSAMQAFLPEPSID
jgi:phytanoyl-CoA hydroxylase